MIYTTILCILSGILPTFCLISTYLTEKQLILFVSNRTTLTTFITNIFAKNLNDFYRLFSALLLQSAFDIASLP